MPSPAFTNLTASGASSATSFTTASVSPSGNQLILVSVHAYISTGSVAPSAPTVTGNGITYTLIGTGQDVDTAGTDRAKMWIFRGMAASPTAGAITISFGATSMTRCFWSVDQSDANVDTTGTNGSGAIAHDPPDGFTASGTVSTISVTYAGGAISTNNSGFTAVCSQTNQAKTPRSGWTELADTFAVTLGSMETQYIAGTDTAASASWTTAARAGIIALEIVGAASGSNFTQSPADTEGLSDAGVTFGHSESGTDPLTLGDAQAYAQGNAITDSLGLTDSVVVAGPQKYLTGVSSNGRYFVDQNGSPYLVRGDSPWALPVKLSSTEVDTYLSNRVSKGTNTLLMSIIGNTVNGGPSDTGATYDGVLPFTGGDPSVFNSTYWTRMDSYIGKIRDAGMSLIIYPIDGWTTLTGGVFDPASITTTQAQTYGNTLATRYPASTYPNISWCFGGDYSETTAINNLMNACLTGIRATGDTRLVSIQLMYETSESDNSTFWEPKVNWDFIYDYRVTYKGISDGYNHTWSVSPTTKPALFSEGAYEGSTDANHPGTDLVIRRQAGWALTSGSPGEFTGQEGVWNFTSGWSSLLNSTATAQLKAMRDAIQGVAWHTLVPDDSNQLVTAGRGTRITTDSATYPTGNTYVTAGRASDGSLAVVYLPNASSAITVDMTKIGSSPTATWVDPTNGTTSSATVGSTYSKGNNAAGATDWFLILTGTPSGSNFTQTPTDSEGLTDAVALSVVKAFTESFGLTDSVALTVSPSLTDSENLTDSQVIDRGSVVVDPEGLTDSASLAAGRAVLPADTEGLTDVSSLVLNYQQQPLDALGVTDSAQISLSGAGSVSPTDNSGLTDSTGIDQAHTLADPEGLSDAVIVDQSKSTLDAEGLTDSAQVSLAGAGTVNNTDPLGLTDPIMIDRAHLFADALGLSDQAQVTKILGPSDTETLGDSTTFTVGAGRTDPVALTDSVAIGGSLSPSDSGGLTDSVILLLNTVRSIIDNAALTDVVQAQLNPVSEVTPRPYTGTTPRPGTGITLRPYTSTTTRP